MLGSLQGLMELPQTLLTQGTLRSQSETLLLSQCCIGDKYVVTCGPMSSVIISGQGTSFCPFSSPGPQLL